MSYFQPQNPVPMNEGIGEQCLYLVFKPTTDLHYIPGPGQRREPMKYRLLRKVRWERGEVGEINILEVAMRSIHPEAIVFTPQQAETIMPDRGWGKLE